MITLEKFLEQVKNWKASYPSIDFANLVIDIGSHNVAVSRALFNPVNGTIDFLPSVDVQRKFKHLENTARANHQD